MFMLQSTNVRHTNADKSFGITITLSKYWGGGGLDSVEIIAYISKQNELNPVVTAYSIKMIMITLIVFVP